MPGIRSWLLLIMVVLSLNLAMVSLTSAEEPVNHEIAETQRKIERAQIELSFQKRPLREVLESLSQQSGVPISVQPHVLHEQGIDHQFPITCESPKRVDLATALTKVLTPLSLSYKVANNGHIWLTALDTSSAEISVRVYDLSSLLSPRNSKLVTHVLRHSCRDLRPEPKSPVVKAIITSIVDEVQPESWQIYGNGKGQGTIEPLSNAEEIVLVRQTASAHREIEELLEQLHRSRALQVLVSAQEFVVDDAAWKTFAREYHCRGDSPILSAEASQELQAIAKRHHAPRHSIAFNGEVLPLEIRSFANEAVRQELLLQTVITADRNAVRLAWEFTRISKEPTKNCHVPVRESLLLEVTPDGQAKQEGEPLALRYFVLITPTILISSECGSSAMKGHEVSSPLRD